MKNILNNFHSAAWDPVLSMGGIRHQTGLTFARPANERSDDVLIMWVDAHEFNRIASLSKNSAYREVKEELHRHGASHPMYIKRTNQGPSQALECPYAHYSEDRGIVFTNGIHRTATWINAGASYIPICFDKRSCALIVEKSPFQFLRVTPCENMIEFLPAVKSVLHSRYSLSPHIASYMTFFPDAVPISYEMKVLEQLGWLLPFEKECRVNFLKHLEYQKDDETDDQLEAKKILMRIDFLDTLIKKILPGYKIMLERGLHFMPEDTGSEKSMQFWRLNPEHKVTPVEIDEVCNNWIRYAATHEATIQTRFLPR